VLIDTGIGPGPHEASGGKTGNLLQEMQSKGVAPESVDIVVFTHLHFDHTGWAVHDGKPLCANARYLAPEADWAALGSGGVFPPADALTALKDSGRLELVSGEKSVTPELSLVPTPGHSPGHQSISIASAGERAFVLGDLFNHPAQLNETDWNAGFDSLPDVAVATRRRAFDRLEQEGTLVISGHYTHPGFGRIVRQEGRRVFRAL
jgi:glyoxylase-like metal-dependent hydrolase (beta-lactamase superfamily II)